MSHRNFFLSFLCLLLFLSISTPVFAAEEPDLSGGVITSIPRQRFLENINPIHTLLTIQKICYPTLRNSSRI